MKKVWNIAGWTALTIVLILYALTVTMPDPRIDGALRTATTMGAISLITILLVGRRWTKYGYGIAFGGAALIEFLLRITAIHAPYIDTIILKETWRHLVLDVIFILSVY